MHIVKILPFYHMSASMNLDSNLLLHVNTLLKKLRESFSHSDNLSFMIHLLLDLLGCVLFFFFFFG